MAGYGASAPRVMTKALRRVDAHVHVWAPKEKANVFPYAGALVGAKASANEPPMPGFASLLLEEMGRAGVSKSVIIQPGNHGFDHSYVNSVLEVSP